MVGKLLMVRSGLIGALCLPAISASAQETGGVQTVFGFEQGLDFGRNTSLEVPAAGDRAAIFTNLSFGLSSETRTQRLSFDLGSIFRIEDFDGETTSEFTSPTVGLTYSREGATASFTAAGTYQRDDVDDLRSLSEFIGDDGIITLPADFADLVGTGQRTEYGADATLTLGIDRPLGFEFGLNASGTDYEDVSSTGLVDIDRRRINGQLRLDLTRTLTTTVGLSYETIEEDDAVQTDREIRSQNVGLSYAVSPRATFGARLGQTQIDTTDTTGGSETSDVTGGADLSYEMPNGVIEASYDASLDIDGDRRQTFQISRSMETPTGSLAASIGVTELSEDNTAMIGSLAWTQDRPTARITARVDRFAALASDEEVRLTTTGNLAYIYDINNLSGLSLGVTHAVAEATSTVNRVEQTELGLTYRYALTRDWDLNTGASYRVRDEDTVGTARSPLLTLSVGREFRAIR